MDVLHTIRRAPAALRSKLTTSKSNCGEDAVIRGIMHAVGITSRYAVDIAASDGVSMSNTYNLYSHGFAGLAVEYDAAKFAQLSSRYRRFPNVNLARCKVTPNNISHLLWGNDVPATFGFLNLDIDSYDYFVLDSLLRAFRPQLICTEINEKIPPPIKFTVLFSEDHHWQEDHFYGQSVSKLFELCPLHKYDLVALHYNNAFMVPRELNALPALTPEEAYHTGYLSKPDRRTKFPWNRDMDILHRVSPEEAMKLLSSKFARYKDKYECSLE